MGDIGKKLSSLGGMGSQQEQTKAALKILVVGCVILLGGAIIFIGAMFGAFKGEGERGEGGGGEPVQDYPQAEMPSGEYQALADQLINNPNVTMDAGTTTCNAKDEIEHGRCKPKDKNGRLTNPPCSAGSTLVRVEPKLIQALIAIANAGHKYNITCILGGTHKSTSAHYVGRAADITPSETIQNWMYTPPNPQTLSLDELIGPTSRTLNMGQPHTYSLDTMAKHKDHIHFSIRH